MKQRFSCDYDAMKFLPRYLHVAALALGLLMPVAGHAQAQLGEPCIQASDCQNNCCVNGVCGNAPTCNSSSSSSSSSSGSGGGLCLTDSDCASNCCIAQTCEDASACNSSSGSSSSGSGSSGSSSSGSSSGGVTLGELCPDNPGASSGTLSSGGTYYEVRPPGSYVNNVNIPNECIPNYPGNLDPGGNNGKCLKIPDCEGVSGGGSSSSGSGSGASSSGPATGNSFPNCQAESMPAIVSCNPGYACSANCVQKQPVCLSYEDENCGCALQVTPEECDCAPSCTIQDPVQYPECCTVEPKGGDYPCVVVCTLPNGDKIDMVDKRLSCQAYPLCCRDYGDLVETQYGDPRDFCKVKCKDSCKDDLHMKRPVPNKDFPECCTPPVPIDVVCACCREAKYRPSSTYCEGFLTFFDCNDPRCVAEDGVCESTIAPTPVYDPDYDYYMQYDERYHYCSAQWNNRKCRYLCKGASIITKDNAPANDIKNIWSDAYATQDGVPPPGTLYETNYTLEVHKNCDIDENEVNPVPWPPQRPPTPTCDDPPPTP